ncbi:hydrophobic/amphiphilic exporter-1, HAE1 family [Lachnospiraceae bacterium C7]|nr:hydrophobic/amphiphilic exporter-1, HAE1 family [Lachnospiraceae bacterium C7]
MISKFSVKKPYTVLVCVLLVIVLGVVSISKMTIDLLPNMSFPYVIVVTTSVGSSPEEVESNVTAPIEASMATTSNIKNITSSSNNSYSMVMLEYEQSTNMDSTIIEIQQKIEQLKSGWDDKVSSPIIMQINPNMLPIMTAAVDVKNLNANELSEYIDNEISPNIESIEGVASVSTAGKLEQKVNVTLKQEKVDELNAKIKEGISAKFSDAKNQMDSASSQIENGKKQMQNGKDTLSNTINETLKQRDESYEKIADITEQLKKLVEQKTSLMKVQGAIVGYMSSASYQNLQKKLESLASLTSAEKITNNDASIESQIAELRKQIEDENSQIRQQFESLKSIGLEVNDYNDLIQVAGVVSEDLATINTQITTLTTALTELSAGNIATSAIIDTLNSNAAIASMEMATNSATLQSAADKLTNSKKEIETAENSAISQADLNQVLSVDTLSQILVAQNFDMPAGYVTENNTKYLVHVGKKVKDVKALRKLPLIDVKMDNVSMIRLEDVADIKMADNSDQTYAKVNNKPAIMLSMEKQTGYSTGDVTKSLKEKFKNLEKDNKNLKFSILMDQGVYIDIIVKSVLQNMIFGAILAIFILMVFLRDYKTTIIIGCSIPLSVIFAVVLMYFMGITLNIISMSGLALGIGMLVDNSIVVVENIFRMKQEGEEIKAASVVGTNQVAGAIIASTLTTVSVYAPIVFTEGITRQLFVDLALTVAFTLVASLVVALTVVPAMSSVILKNSGEKEIKWFTKIKDQYENFLGLCLNHKVIVLSVTVAFLIISAIASLSKGMTFMDMDMETNQISVTLSSKDDETLKFDELKKLSDEAIKRIRKVKGVETVGAMAGGNSGISVLNTGSSTSATMYVLLDEKSDESVKEVSKNIEKVTKDMKCKIKVESSSVEMTAATGDGIAVQIKGRDIDKLQSITKKVYKLVKETEGTIDVSDGLDNEMDEFEVTVDKEKAAEHSYTVAQAYQLIYNIMKSETSATTIETDVKDYKVYLASEKQNDVTLDTIKNLTFTSKDISGAEKQVPLSDIASFKKTKTLSSIARDSQSRYLTVSAKIDDKHNVTLVGNKIQSEIDKLDIPSGYSVKMSGEDENIKESMGQLTQMLVLAVIFIYLIMVAQFQSLVSPFIIMFTIPLAFTGGFLGLFITGKTLSIIAMIGFIMLAGLIVNNGIVLIDYINQSREEGMEKREAIISAGLTRIRPILMTALTTILSMITMAIGVGDGSELMQPMAITIIGGMIYGTLLTLVVEPCIYDIVHHKE